ncbi:MAG: hypothetical protein GX608_07160 [Lentisphaerae bacterium]|nr:hypothetical protein [Lentisphaerota bacterium]
MTAHCVRWTSALALAFALAQACSAGWTHSSEIVLVNLTGGNLRLVDTQDDSHTHWDVRPPNLITNSGTASFKMYTEKLFYGCDGGATFKLDRGGTINVRIQNTFASGNHYYRNISGVPPMAPPDGPGDPQPLFINVYGPAHGNFISGTFIVSWKDMDASAGNVDWKQINQKVGESYKELEASPVGK